MKVQGVLHGLKRFVGIRGCLVVILVGAIPLWIFGIAPQILRIPDTFSYKADVISVDNFYDEVRGEYRGEQYSQTEFSYAVVQKEEDVLTIRNTFHVRTLSGETIFTAEPLYGIDALTGKHVYGYGDKNRDGYLFAPRGVKEGQSFTYWHAISSVPAVMTYQGTEYLYGLRVFRFSSNYGGAIDQTQALGFLPDVGETRGIRLESVNTLWIEPVTGYLVKQEDSSKEYYYYDLQTGERIGPYNQFINSYSEASVQEHVRTAMIMRYVVFGVLYGVPILFGILALFCAVWIFGRKTELRHISGMHVASGIALLFMLSASLAAYVFVKFSIDQRLRAEMMDESMDIEKKITRQIELYSSALYGGRALFDASESVSREEWRAYVGSLELSQHYPGILAFAYAPAITEEGKAAFVQAIRDEGFGDFDIWPNGDRSTYTPVDFIEPWNADNQRAFGFDMFSNETRRNAMIRAAESGAPSATSSVRLAQEEQGSERAGFLLFIPVFSHHAEGELQDTGAPIGYVYSAFYIDAIISGIGDGISSNVDFSVYDGIRATPEQLVFASFASESEPEESQTTFFQRTTTIFFGGMPWVLQFSNAQKTLGTVFDRALPGIAFALGSLLSISVFGIMFSVARSKERATELARTLTKDLAEEERALEEQNALLEEKLVELDRTNKAMIDRELRMIELKEELKKYETHSR